MSGPQCSSPTVGLWLVCRTFHVSGRLTSDSEEWTARGRYFCKVKWVYILSHTEQIGYGGVGVDRFSLRGTRGSIYEWKCAAKQTSEKRQCNVKSTQSCSSVHLMFSQLSSVAPKVFIFFFPLCGSSGKLYGFRMVRMPRAPVSHRRRKEQVGQRQVESTCCNSYELIFFSILII